MRKSVPHYSEQAVYPNRSIFSLSLELQIALRHLMQINDENEETNKSYSNA